VTRSGDAKQAVWIAFPTGFTTKTHLAAPPKERRQRLVLARLVAGVVVGFAFGGVSYPLARWQFGPWLECTGAEIGDAVASGRLTSA
jgi:hypothetical protein